MGLWGDIEDYKNISPDDNMNNDSNQEKGSLDKNELEQLLSRQQDKSALEQIINDRKANEYKMITEGNLYSTLHHSWPTSEDLARFTADNGEPDPLFGDMGSQYPHNIETGSDAPARDNDRIRPHDDNTISHEIQYLDYLFVDEKYRQAMSAIFTTEDISSGEVLVKLAETGKQIKVRTGMEFEENLNIYKVLTDGVIFYDFSPRRGQFETIATSEGFRMPKPALYARDENMKGSFYIFKHDSQLRCSFTVELELRDINNDLNG
jgi:hypothetical protein